MARDCGPLPPRETAAPEGAGDGASTTYLACEACESPVLRASDLLPGKAAVWGAAVYPYELSVLDVECWCYSATNALDHRFDVVRVAAGLPGVELRGEASAEHSWFTGYAWAMAHCALCGHHLGWGFHPTATDPPPGDAAPPSAPFLGLVVTRMTIQELSDSQVAQAATRRAEALRCRPHIQELLHLLTDLPLGVGQRFFEELVDLYHTHDMHTLVHRLLEEARARAPATPPPPPPAVGPAAAAPPPSPPGLEGSPARGSAGADWSEDGTLSSPSPPGSPDTPPVPPP